VVEARPDGIVVATGSGALRLLEVQLEGKRRLPASAFLAGHPLAAAHEVLLRVETTDAFADVLLADRLGHARLSAADRGLTTRLVYGTLAWQGRLDHHLQTLLHAPLDGLEPPVRAALRLGLYQLLFLDRVPPWAAVDASVRLARRTSRGGAGLVNAVLRRAASAGPAGLALPDATHDPLERLAIEWSHPRWVVEQWAAELGFDELPALLAADNSRGPTALRTNTSRTTRAALGAELEAAGVDTVPSRWAADGLLVERGADRLRQLPAWREGHFAFQGESSQLIAPLLGAGADRRLLDACAAPGGKAAQMATFVDEPGLVLALDSRTAGARRIRAEATRLRAGSLLVAAADARRPPLAEQFDAVLVDAPCSGLGTLRRHPELRWRRRPEDLPRLGALQRAILAGVAPLVRPGGILVYAVCTLAREENEEVVRWLTGAEPRFVPEHAARDGGAPPQLVTPEGFLKTFPHRHGLDGFFAARWRARA
jgi:16S rRNA (cytosine967-C5)-methyltransferase